MSLRWLYSVFFSKSSSQDAQHKEIRQIIEGFVTRCGVRYAVAPLSEEFYTACCEEGRRWDVPVDSLVPVMRAGATIAQMAYGHLSDTSIQISIAVYTALLLHIDDAYFGNIDLLRKFPERFLKGKPQSDAVLDSLAKCLHEFPYRFGDLQANLILTATLNFVASVILEHDLNGVKTPPKATKFVHFSRLLSSLAGAYTVFIFPPNMPYQVYVHAFPEIMVMIAYVNDILSFYKEEVAGETVNYVSIMATSNQVKKVDALRTLVDESIASLNITSELLVDEGAHAAIKSWLEGYINFHFSSARYRLDEVFLFKPT